MRDITLKELLEAGCHFGHQARRWQPKAQEYIYTERDGVHIIDLVKTKAGLAAAAAYLQDLAQSGGSVIFVGTKRQAKEIVEEAAKKVRGSEIKDEIRDETKDKGYEIKDRKMESGPGEKTNNFYYLLERWPGGFLTNFDIIKKNNLDAIVKLREDITESSGRQVFVTKREKLLAQRKLDKYAKIFGGLVGLTKIPEAIFLVDVKKEDGAIREAKARGVKIIAICDTNVDPRTIDYQIPANDDAKNSIKIVTEYLAEAWVEGLKSIGS